MRFSALLLCKAPLQYGSLDAFSCSSLTYTRCVHRPLVFYSSKLQNPNPKPGFEGVQFETRVWK